MVSLSLHLKRCFEWKISTFAYRNKRQLMYILHVMYLYNQLKDNPDMDMIPRTFIFGAKAAAGYKRAKPVSYTHLV